MIAMLDSYFRMHRTTHERCGLDHAAQWQNVGKKVRELDPNFFGSTIYWASCHCGRLMRRYRAVQQRRCMKCGLTEEVVVRKYAQCIVCHHQTDMVVHQK